jgi:hypothetical protein
VSCSGGEGRSVPPPAREVGVGTGSVCDKAEALIRRTYKIRGIGERSFHRKSTDFKVKIYLCSDRTGITYSMVLGTQNVINGLCNTILLQ